MSIGMLSSEIMAAELEQSSFSHSNCAVEIPYQHIPTLSPSNKRGRSLSVDVKSLNLSPDPDEKPSNPSTSDDIVKHPSWAEMELQFSEKFGVEYSWLDLRPGIQKLLEESAWEDVLSIITSIFDVASKPAGERRKGKMRNYFHHSGGLRGNWRFLQPQFSRLSQEYRGNDNGWKTRREAQLSRKASHEAQHLEIDTKQNQPVMREVVQPVVGLRVSRSNSTTFGNLHPRQGPVRRSKTVKPQSSKVGGQSQSGMFGQTSIGSETFTISEVMNNEISSPSPNTQLLQTSSESCRNQAEGHKYNVSSFVDSIFCTTKASPEVGASQESSSTLEELHYRRTGLSSHHGLETQLSNMQAMGREEHFKGGEWISDENLLMVLRGLDEEMKVSASMARKHCSSKKRVTALQIPCVYKEDINTPPAASSIAFLELFRELLEVPSGVLLRDMLTSFNIEGCEIRIWVSAIISALVQEFVFGSEVPFDVEGEEVFRGMFEKQGKSKEYIDSMLYHHRVEIFNIMSKPEGPNIVPHFAAKLKNLRDSFVVKLNKALFPLVGGNTKTEKHHRKIAIVAEQLLLITSAYNGTFMASSLRIHEPIDLADYELAVPPDADSQRFEGEPCLVTTMMAVHFTRPGNPSRILSLGKVHHLPLIGSDEPPIKRQRLDAKGK